MKNITSIRSFNGAYKIITKEEESIVISKETLIHTGLYKGMEISDEDWSQLFIEDQFYQARGLALNYLKRRRTSGEIRNFLSGHDFSSECIDKVIHYLMEYGFINDQQYIRDFIHDQFLLNQNGPYKIKYQLKRKDLDDDLIETGLAELNEEDIQSTLQKLIEKKYGAGPFNFKEKQKINRYLQNKGYPYSLISKEIF